MPVTTLRTPISTLYVDYINVSDPDAGLAIINTVPENGETRVQTTSHIALHVVAFNAALDVATLVYITINGVRELAYDQAGSGFQPGYAGAESIATLQMSPGAAVNDELLLTIDLENDLASEAEVIVEVFASSAGEDFNAAYSFTAENTAQPVFDEILWIDPRRFRGRFKDPMQANSLAHGTLFFTDISGAYYVEAPNKITLRGIDLDADWLGCWLGLTGSAYPQNNRYLEIIGFDAANSQILVNTISKDLKNDTGIDQDADGNIIRERVLKGTISSYRIASQAINEDEIQCAYEPLITALRLPTVEEIPQDADASRYIIVDLHDDISFGRRYHFHCVKVVNDLGTEAIESQTFQTVTPWFGMPTTRARLWEQIIPAKDREDDLENGTGELRKIALTLQDLFNSLWYRTDKINSLFDPDDCPREWLPFLLYTLGNPFQFPLTELQQRRLASVLIPIHRKTGVEAIIEDTLAFFLGGEFVVKQFISTEFWPLGTAALGIGTILGPDTRYARNCYEIISSITLNDDQRRMVRDIAEYLDPLYMHLLRIVEPGDTPTFSAYWVLGESALEIGTMLSL